MSVPVLVDRSKENSADTQGLPVAESTEIASRFLAGTAPMSFQSGQTHRMHLRRQCNKSLRNAVHLWANLSREFSPCAATYYTALRAKGKSHTCALRALGQRWLKIVWKMWQTRTSYDADFHARNQIKHDSWVLQLVNHPAADKT